MSPLKLFKCLADDTRLKSVLIISQLGEACVCELMAALELDQPKVSRHLAELRKCDILQDQRRGKWVYYQLHQQLPGWAKEIILKTAEENAGYYLDALARLEHPKQKTLPC
ncbi:HTH-type transcriptional repressor AseR (plasmid) [Pseudoalteromonas sp. THAF3]|uniref:metalloregulator ArsR/SmtB family transcription factor n=1 Tax=Pseudoalteromonas TaxID=53246 RepID=UPI0003B4BC2A|nr:MULTISPECIES: metalloregulator ArsR/SmtB family transcription factor [Pseudoalteromonas]MCG7546166.1 metalloregulator ArsR/SmtB family transcription factor [Pseudoalteromonas sp. MM17-2]QFU06410.1 HTH-type transcriptional repressor AseR [Pseudoalteromonas sp. THAF3]TLX49303.1 transcriptional regulator [Pseudoalteromonas ruthenica]TMO49885.1 transcriptional regulator [Pseudoalteromonas ruthenica]TMO50563.1 transcriptional regulator [Pseudoalteromonas ruthenica]